MKAKALFTAFLLLLLFGCGGGGGRVFITPSGENVPPADSSILAMGSIGPAGGTISVQDTGTPHDGTRLIVPSDALARNEIITISTASRTAAPETLTIALAPSGMTFSTTVTLVIPYSDQFLANNGIEDPMGIRMALVDQNTGEVELLPVIARDTAAKTVTAALTHFSWFTRFGSATQPPGFVQTLPEQETPKRITPGLPERVRTERTLLIIHGICNDAEGILGCADGILGIVKTSAVLTKQYKNIFAFNYPWKRGINGNDDLPEIESRPAQFLQRALAEVRGANPNVDIISHSMGGLVARYALEQVDEDKKARAAIRNLVMIATPSGGVIGGTFRAIQCTVLEISLDFQAAKDLNPVGSKIWQLKSSQFENSHPRYFTIAGDLANSGFDVVVPGPGVAIESVQLDVPGSTATRPPAYEHLTFRGKIADLSHNSAAGHTGIHCRASERATIGEFVEISSNTTRTFEAGSNNVATVLATLLRDTAANEQTVPWSFDFRARYFRPRLTLSSVALGADGTVFLGTIREVGLGEEGPFVALDPATGNARWQFDSPYPTAFHSSPAIAADGVIYATTNQTLYAFDPATGVLKWQQRVEPSAYSSPAIANGTLYLGWLAGLSAINASTGEIQWRFSADDRECACSPAIAADGTIYIGSESGVVFAVTQKGTERWRFQTGGAIRSSPAIAADGVIYIGSSDNTLYALEGATGTKKWEALTEGAIEAGPVLGSDGTVYVGSLDGKLYAFDSRDGSRRWTFDTKGEILGSALVGNDGIVYIGSKSGRIFALDGTNGAKLWEMDSGSAITGSLALSPDGKLYVLVSDNVLYAIQTASQGLANSSWPKFHRDARNSGLAGNP